MRVYNSNTGRINKRRRIGEFSFEILQFKRSFSPEQQKEFRGRMFSTHGILI